MNQFDTLVARLKNHFLSFDRTRDRGRGTVFPTDDLRDRDRYFRTDLGWDCYYDAAGTRWLTQHEYSTEFTTYGGASQPYSGGATSLLMAPIRIDRQIYATYARVFAIVQTTNNAANYWGISLNADASVLWAFTTSATAPNTNLYFQTALASQNGPNLFTFDVSKTGAPGALILHGIMYYRLVVP